MDLRKIKKLIELVEESSIEELEVANGDESIRIVLPRERGALQSHSAITTVAAQPATAPKAAADVSPSDAVESGHRVESPMAGTFYRASHPEAAPFVEVGQQIEAGAVLCIIESMKMMHEIRAPHSGEIVEICAHNAQPIGTGEMLFRVS